MLMIFRCGIWGDVSNVFADYSPFCFQHHISPLSPFPIQASSILVNSALDILMICFLTLSEQRYKISSQAILSWAMVEICKYFLITMETTSESEDLLLFSHCASWSCRPIDARMLSPEAPQALGLAKQ